MGQRAQGPLAYNSSHSGNGNEGGGGTLVNFKLELIDGMSEAEHGRTLVSVISLPIRFPSFIPFTRVFRVCPQP